MFQDEFKEFVFNILGGRKDIEDFWVDGFTVTVRIAGEDYPLDYYDGQESVWGKAKKSKVAKNEKVLAILKSVDEALCVAIDNYNGK